jgi:uncharacterized protein YndB with AHSA1/START domain/predicted enzyme related to lactoylglutathione lyase
MPNNGSLKVTTPAPNEIVLTRTFDAPWELVYEALTTPTLIRRWWGAKRGTMTVCEVDLRVGGRYRFAMKTNSGMEIAFSGEWRELSPPDRMVHTERFENAPGEAVITTKLVEERGRTTMIATCVYSSPEVRDAVIRSGMEGGAAESYDALDGVVKGRMFEKVAFTMYPVKDTARARAFYEGTLGLEVGSHSDNGIWTEYDLPGGGCLALFRTDDTKPSNSAGGTVAFEVRDLDALVARLEKAGVEVKMKGIESPVCWMAVILDSEGNGILLHQLKHKH